eukprot:scaffold21731_cov134-Isochrysis_galbana.AAC.4
MSARRRPTPAFRMGYRRCRCGQLAECWSIADAEGLPLAWARKVPTLCDMCDNMSGSDRKDRV